MFHGDILTRFILCNLTNISKSGTVCVGGVNIKLKKWRCSMARRTKNLRIIYVTDKNGKKLKVIETIELIA